MSLFVLFLCLEPIRTIIPRKPPHHFTLQHPHTPLKHAVVLTRLHEPPACVAAVVAGEDAAVEEVGYEAVAEAGGEGGEVGEGGIKAAGLHEQAAEGWGRRVRKERKREEKVAKMKEK